MRKKIIRFKIGDIASVSFAGIKILETLWQNTACMVEGIARQIAVQSGDLMGWENEL